MGKITYWEDLNVNYDHLIYQSIIIDKELIENLNNLHFIFEVRMIVSVLHNRLENYLFGFFYDNRPRIIPTKVRTAHFTFL